MGHYFDSSRNNMQRMHYKDLDILLITIKFHAMFGEFVCFVNQPGEESGTRIFKIITSLLVLISTLFRWTGV